ncbi:kinase-like domain-containing protein [Chaetomium strumarium]|uniref:non-specific serine/threonine protein kinase n=1 Tax=Chaetomium strumarium TaxID=1170767 RepID=A0AAJ0LZG5_9PEZI|nr:kinase-like domain-containing protein [Chaetomium strumarium]
MSFASSSNPSSVSSSPLSLNPVRKADLVLAKHKVFRGGSETDHRIPPFPFVGRGASLGRSGTTTVYRVAPPDGYDYRRPLALKVISCQGEKQLLGSDSEARSRALKEVKTMSRLRHPHIVAYVASFESFCFNTRLIRYCLQKRTGIGAPSEQRVKDHVLAIAMYPPAGGNLNTFMSDVFLDPSRAKWIIPRLHSFFGCLTQAVTHLHKQGVQIWHKDIKPENIVVDDFGQPMLTDSGLSKHFETGDYSEGPTPKTLKYADPESLAEQRRDERSDIFSLGCVYLEIVTVLLGQPAKNTSNRRSEDRPFKYADALPNLPTYLATLTSLGHELAASDPSRERSVHALLPVLPRIQEMMSATQHLRPEAHQLYPWFYHLYSVYDQIVGGGVCANCEAERRTGNVIIIPGPSSSQSSSSSQNRNQSGMLSRTSTVGSGVGGAPSSSSSQGHGHRRRRTPSHNLRLRLGPLQDEDDEGGNPASSQWIPPSSQWIPTSSPVDVGECSG